MTVGQAIEKLKKFSADTELVIVVDQPEQSPRKVVDIVADDFDEVDRAAILTKMEEA
jgi:hypothetical protein